MINIQHNAKNIINPVYSSFIPNIFLTTGDGDTSVVLEVVDAIDDDIVTVVFSDIFVLNNGYNAISLSTFCFL